MKTIGSLSIILIFTLIGGQISVKCKLPAVVGEIIAGIIIGPAVLNIVQPGNFIKEISDIGVILLMLLAGLESDLQTLKKLWRPSLLVAILGVIIPILVAYLTGIWFHFSKISSLFLGLIFAATSVSISIAVLQEMNCLDTKEGMTILGAAVVDDLLAVFLLSFLSNVAKAAGGSCLQLNFGWKLMLQIGFLMSLFFIGLKQTSFFMKLTHYVLLPAAEILMCLIVVFSVSFFTEYIGLSSAIGAFVVGLGLSQTDFKNKLQNSFIELGYGIFIPIFFAGIGLEISISGIFKNLLLFILLLFGSIFSKLLGAGIGAKLAGFTFSSSFQVASGMVSRGEMALVVAQIGLNSHLLKPSIYSTVVGVIIFTTLIAPLLLKFTLTKVH